MSRIVNHVTGHQPVGPDQGPALPPSDESAHAKLPHHKHPEPDEGEGVPAKPSSK